jgi:hypothetical protein
VLLREGKEEDFCPHNAPFPDDESYCLCVSTKEILQLTENAVNCYLACILEQNKAEIMGLKPKERTFFRGDAPFVVRPKRFSSGLSRLLKKN